MRITASILLIFALLMGPLACKKEAPAPPAPDVYVLELKAQPTVVYQEWVGSMSGAIDTQIKAQVKGYLKNIAYKEGSKVEAGDLLFEIDPRDAKAAVAKAQAAYRRISKDVKRMKSLVSSGAVSRKEYDDARESLAAAKGELDQAKIGLEFTTIRAPFSGIIGISNAKIGDLVGGSQEGQVITTLSQLDSVKVDFAISEQTYLELMGEKGMDERTKDREARQARGEARLQLILADGQVYRHKGQVMLVDRQINTSTGTITVEASFPNPEGLLRPGLFSKVRAPLKEIPDALLVPQRSVRDLQGIKQLALVDAKNTVKFVNVTLGDETGSFVIVEEGVKAGDKVVVEGIQKVRNGITVNPQPAPEKMVPQAETLSGSNAESIPASTPEGATSEDRGDHQDKDKDKDPTASK